MYHFISPLSIVHKSPLFHGSPTPQFERNWSGRTSPEFCSSNQVANAARCQRGIPALDASNHMHIWKIIQRLWWIKVFWIIHSIICMYIYIYVLKMKSYDIHWIHRPEMGGSKGYPNSSLDGFWTRENPIEMDENWGTPMTQEMPIYTTMVWPLFSVNPPLPWFQRWN